MSPSRIWPWSDSAAAGGINAPLDDSQTRREKGQDQEETIKQNVIHSLSGLIQTFNIPSNAESPGRSNLGQ